jgi:acetyl esterase
MGGGDLRRKAGSKVAEGFFWGLSKLGRLHPLSRPERHNVEVVKDIPYLDSGMAEHRLDVYRPTDAGGPLPVCLYVHGGGFRILSKDSHWLMGLIFARRGFLVFNVNYRLAPRYPFPSAVEDVCAAYAWVAANAGAWGGDLDRLVFAGESAGGNLVTSLTVALCYDRPEPYTKPVREAGILPKAVVPACPILEVSNPERFREKMRLTRFVQDRISEVAREYLPDSIPRDERDLADVLRIFERKERPARSMPPFFTPCGGADPLHDDAQRFERAMAELGSPCEVRIYDREHHAFHAMIFRPNARQCWRDTFAFLDRHLPGSVRQL